MKFFMYSIRDALTGFMTPVLEQNDASAMRNFRVACENPASSLMYARSEQFSLFRIASFDSETGVLSPVVPPEIICQGERQDVKV